VSKYTFSSKKKDRKKVIRSIIQGAVIIIFVYITAISFFSSDEYIPFKDSERSQTEDGFIAISYFGVDRAGNGTLISKKKLDEHLQALKASGYVTITQDDIKNYYLNNKPLPPGSLFLMFEDGRKDTAVFAQKVLEKHNYKASILTYAQNLQTKSTKFLSSKELRFLLNNSFWELGSNGYRLSYINVFDRHGNFLNQLDSNEYERLSPYLDKNYNHYLMDYIRDENGIPMEDFDEMQERISYDYKMMQDIYEESIGKMPGLYALMHSNTGRFGTNKRVSEVNKKWICQLFDMNFNREGNCRNLPDSSIYDLTRIQPQAYWSANHLLMRIWNDTNKDMAFVSGDVSKKKDWDTLLGESEFADDMIILTSLPKGRGLMFLKNSEGYKDIALSVTLNGNKAGSQVIYLRSDKDLDQYISVQIINNVLHIFEKEYGGEKEKLFSLDLDVHDEVVYRSMEENKLESEIQYLKTKIKYAANPKEANELLSALDDKKRELKGIEEGDEKYIPKTDISEQASRLLGIRLKGDSLSVYIDNKKVFEDMEVSVLDPGYVGLESSFSGYGYSQKSLSDDIYDGIFKELIITEASSQKGEPEQILYSNKLTSFEKMKYDIDVIWGKVIDWFIKHL